MNTLALLSAPILPSILRLAAPNMLAMTVMLATSAAEAWYVGQLGTTALAGLALAFPMFMLMTMMSAGAMGGAVAGAVAQALGANNHLHAERLALHAVFIALAAGGFFSIIFLSFGIG
jgi:Na+-driven multidrug efflux pump